MDDQGDESRPELTAEEYALAARFWSRFYSESLRLFGDKKGQTFAEMMRRAMRVLRAECAAYAADPEGFDNPRPKRSGSFNVEAFKEHCDELARKRWRRPYNESAVILTYLNLIHPFPPELGGGPPMDRREAVEEVARRFRFASRGACYEYLKKHGIQGEDLAPDYGYFSGKEEDG